MFGAAYILDTTFYSKFTCSIIARKAFFILRMFIVGTVACANDLVRESLLVSL